MNGWVKNWKERSWPVTVQYMSIPKKRLRKSTRHTYQVIRPMSETRISQIRVQERPYYDIYCSRNFFFPSVWLPYWLCIRFCLRGDSSITSVSWLFESVRQPDDPVLESLLLTFPLGNPLPISYEVPQFAIVNRFLHCGCVGRKQTKNEERQIKESKEKLKQVRMNEWMESYSSLFTVQDFIMRSSEDTWLRPRRMK